MQLVCVRDFFLLRRFVFVWNLLLWTSKCLNRKLYCHAVDFERKDMENELKKNIRKTAIFMLIAATVPFILCLSVFLTDVITLPVVCITQLFYLISCFFIWIWGTVKVIWKLPCRKFFRVPLTLAWLIFYPILCCLWYLLFCWWLSLVIHVSWIVSCRCSYRYCHLSGTWNIVLRCSWLPDRSRCTHILQNNINNAPRQKHSQYGNAPADRARQ